MHNKRRVLNKTIGSVVLFLIIVGMCVLPFYTSAALEMNYSMDDQSKPANRSSNSVLPTTLTTQSQLEVPMIFWSSAGSIPGRHCIQVIEPADPHTWNDNYLCTDIDYGFKWSYAGTIPGMSCLSMNESADPHTWGDNYLCAPLDYGYIWSTAGPVPNMTCVQIHETADPDTWTDNYICWSGPTKTPLPIPTPTPCIDNDGDGYCQENDCDDYNSSIYPGASTNCTYGEDRNCNGQDDYNECYPY
jgi:hypothetical protein